MIIITPKKQFLNKDKQFSCCTNNISSSNHQQNQYLAKHKIPFTPIKQKKKIMINPQLFTIHQNLKTPIIGKTKRDFQTDQLQKQRFHQGVTQQTCYGYSKLRISYIDDVKQTRYSNPQNYQRLHQAEKRPIILLESRNDLGEQLNETIKKYKRIYDQLRGEETKLVNQRTQKLQTYQNSLQKIEQTRNFLNSNQKIRQEQINELRKGITNLNTYLKTFAS